MGFAMVSCHACATAYTCRRGTACTLQVAGVLLTSPCATVCVPLAGFHLIKHAEGSRDLAAAIYTHMATCPEYILQDNACHSMDYALNREVGGCCWHASRL